MTGYHWCEHCEDNAYGETCQSCRRPAVWIENASRRDFQKAENDAAPARLATPKRSAGGTPVDKLSATEWFRRMREQVANTPSFLDHKIIP